MMIITVLFASTVSAFPANSCDDRAVVCQFGGSNAIAYTVRDERIRRFIVESPGGLFSELLCSSNSLRRCNAKLVADKQGRYHVELEGSGSTIVLDQYGSWGGTIKSIFEDFSNIRNDMEFLGKSYKRIENLDRSYNKCHYRMIGLFVAEHQIAACDGNFWLEHGKWIAPKE